MNQIKAIAYYLPQYHPIPENDEWWGKGFTEWTNVTKAKPLFKGHLQPFLPSDLGFYDLRIPEVREEQAKIAREAGVFGFCYWHYWFGNGKQILERPINEVIDSAQPDFPICLAWANETWSGRWHGLSNKILIKQEYFGEKDFEDFFYSCLPAFKDSRYIKIDGKLLFSIYKPFDNPSIIEFIKLWRKLARENNLVDFYFIGLNSNYTVLSLGFDAYSIGTPTISENLVDNNFVNKAFRRVFKHRLSDLLRNRRLDGPNIYNYKDIVKIEQNRELGKKEIPVVLSNWDNTPRSGRRGIVIKGSTPELFKKLLVNSIQKANVTDDGSKLIFLKSWNEWAEGNTIEPSMEFGRQYLDSLKSVLTK